MNIEIHLFIIRYRATDKEKWYHPEFAIYQRIKDLKIAYLCVARQEYNKCGSDYYYYLFTKADADACVARLKNEWPEGYQWDVSLEEVEIREEGRD